MPLNIFIIFDVTLIGDDNIPVEAHEIVLSAHSSFLRKTIFLNPFLILYLPLISKKN